MSPKEITKVDMTNDVFKEPIEVVKQLSSKLEGLKYTKVIQTFVMEDRRLNLSLENQGSSYFKGKVVWIGNKKDDSDGTIFCVDTRSELKQINPTAENTESILLDIKKETIRIFTASKTKCAVCGKILEPVEIKVIERQSMLSKRKYLCASCRKIEYNNYIESVKKLVEKK